MPPKVRQNAAMESTPEHSDAPAPLVVNRRRSLILGLVGIAVIVLIFWKVIPQIGSYAEAANAIASMSAGTVVIIVVSVLVYLAVYGFPFVAATPGLGFWPAQQVNQAAFAISNGVPGGGALGLGVQYAMLATYAVKGTVATAAITAVGLWSMFVTLAVPLLGVLTLAAAGGSGGPYLPLALTGLGVLVAAVVVLVLVVRSESLAARIGSLGNRIASPLRRRVSRLPDLVPVILQFRRDTHDLLARRWSTITGAQLAVTLAQFAILYVALRGIEGWDSTGTPLLLAFSAFAIAQLGLMIPLTPGGLGTVDAAMIGLLVATGTTPGVATAAALVWRAASFIPQICVGVVCLLAWYRRAQRLVVRVA
jgi:uncharacterized membrane protein YbhN (UPF0104 family)